ncbi:MAG: helix-turn-helix domain-containing protein [Solirubrobacterales bacterium]|nr:helix-turn-helix domain-containing protein [Solirubrobacterales bacterium]
MKVVHLNPGDQTVAEITDEIQRLLVDGKRVAVTVAVEDELLSPQQAADRLGFSRQHVVRLINAGELAGQQMPGSSYWQIPAGSLLAFEQRRQAARERADAFSRSLDDLGAPLE